MIETRKMFPEFSLREEHFSSAVLCRKLDRRPSASVREDYSYTMQKMTYGGVDVQLHAILPSVLD
jgi:hypothetical protein